MKSTLAIQTENRTQYRIFTDAGITCRPFTINVDQASDGIMLNFSRTGFYIETSREFKPGTFIIVRMTRYPSISASLAVEGRLRSICLAEVRWMKVLSNENTVHYGMGVKYLE